MAKALPSDLNAEMVAVTSALSGAEANADFCRLVDASMFFYPLTRKLAERIGEMHKAGKIADPLSLKNWMEARGDFAVDEVSDNQGCVTAGSYVGIMTAGLQIEGWMEASCQIIRDTHIQRTLFYRAQDVAKQALNPDRTVEWKIQQAATITHGLIVASGGAVTASDVDLTPREMGASIGLGWSLDSATGGCHGGQISVCQAKRKGGKTTAMVQMALGELQDGGTVIFVPIADMTASDICRKMVRQMCGWDKPPTQPSLNDAYYQTVDEFRGFGDRLAIWDPNLANGSTDIESITAWLDAQIHRKRPTKVFLDYFQRLTTRDSKEFSAATYATIAQKLGKWAHRYPDIVTWAGSQETEDGRAAWTRELENETALSVRLVKPEGSESRRIATVELNRFGPMGGSVNLEFDMKYLAFRQEKSS